MSAASAAGLAVSARPSAALGSGTNDSIRLGVIGVGERGTELARDFTTRSSSHERVRVVAVCDVCEARLQRAAALSGAEAVREWERVVDRSDVDAVVIATPNHWHAPMAIAAMQSGKDVYIETPMTHTLAEAKKVRDVAATTGRCVQVGAHETSEGTWRAAAALVRAGRIGKIQWCQASERTADSGQSCADVPGAQNLDWERWLGSAPMCAFDPQRFLHWRNYWDYSGGVAANDFFHKLAPILMAIGPAFPQRVSAAGGVYVNDGREAPDSFVMTAEYAEGHTIVLASSPAHAQGIPAVIRGTDATIYFERGKLNVVPEGARGAETTFNPFAEIPARPSHMDNWLQCIRTRERCACDAELGYRAMAAIGMAVEAYRGGRTLYWDAANDTAVSGPPRGVLA
ncbi:MAG: Gfo/Idh/MocA family oxidoreductase [Candidatus Hydrogenedentes bacterium]|nr:Gfo/Idh/MocA family oxidoreductase [Candidatus Hydrogenedentota bacterium]